MRTPLLPAAFIALLAAPHTSLAPDSRVALVWGASVVAAQTLPRLDPKAIRPGVDTFVVTYGSQTIGRSIQALDQETDGPGLLWRQGYVFQSAEGEISTDTLWVDAASLIPVGETRNNSEGRFIVFYGPKRVLTTHLLPGGDSTKTDVPITGPVYASATLELIARSLPLQGGLEVPVTLYYGAPSGREVVQTTFRVPRADSLRYKDGLARPVWIVTVGAAGEMTTFWVDQEDRRVLQFDVEEGSAVIHFRRGS